METATTLKELDNGEDLKMSLLNVAGNNNELLVYTDYILDMYRPWLFQSAPQLAKRLVAIRNFCMANKEYIKPYLLEDEEMLDLYTEHLGDFFSCYRKATPVQRWQYIQAFAQLNESFQKAVRS